MLSGLLQRKLENIQQRWSTGKVFSLLKKREVLVLTLQFPPMESGGT